VKTVKAYQCSFCDEKFHDMANCYEHEVKCYSNPKAKACNTCAFLTTLPFMEAGFTITVFSCLANKIVFPSLKTNCPEYYNVKKRDRSILHEKAKKSYIPILTIEEFKNVCYDIPEPF
jgi:hypothetical protein